MRATAWRIRRGDIGVAIDAGIETPPGHQTATALPRVSFQRDVDYLSSMEWRFVQGRFGEPGGATAWIRMRIPLIDGEEVSPLTRVLCATDSGSGISSVLDWSEWLFINTDITVHLHRLPRDEWVCLQAVTAIDGAGIGTAGSLIFDTSGYIGRGAQSLYVARHAD